MLYVGFYVPKTGKILDFEAMADGTMQDCRMGAMSLTMEYQRNKKNTIPSPYWVVWDPSNSEEMSVFYLDKGIPSEDIMDAAEKAALAYKPN